MNIRQFYFILLAILCKNILALEYISGNAFKDYADYRVEGTTYFFDPKTIPSKSVIYVKTCYLEYFFQEIFPRIQNPIILLTHNGDPSVPNTYAHYLDDQKIIMWFGINCDIPPHPKFCNIPLGIANENYEHGNPDMWDEVLDILSQQKDKVKEKKIYINWGSTHTIRAVLYDFFKNKPFVMIGKHQEPREYLLDMAKYRFVISPFGGGLDCHRTWEALLVGSIPLVQTSTLDPLFKDLPVIIVQNWEEITEDFLEQKYSELSKKNYNFEKLYLNYWLTILEHYKNSKLYKIGEKPQGIS